MSIIDTVFDDEVKFVAYVQSHGSPEELRKLRKVIITDKLRYWYCRWVFNNKKFAAGITSQIYKDLYALHVLPMEEGHKNWELIQRVHGGYLQQSSISRGKVLAGALALARLSKK